MSRARSPLPDSNVRPAIARPRVITPRLRVLLTIVLLGVAVMVANSAVLLAATIGGEASGRTIAGTISIWAFLVHVVLGLLLVVPFVLFGLLHARRAWRSPNRRAARVGIALLACGIVLVLTGIALLRVDGASLPGLTARTPRAIVWWLHALVPLVALWLFWLHRMVGPRIRWRVGAIVAAVALVGTAIPFLPRPSVSHEAFPLDLAPSATRVRSAELLPTETLMGSASCAACHPRVHADWHESAHARSSFDNPIYLHSIRALRAHAMAADGTVQDANHCAACHDPVPLFAGQLGDSRFDDPAFDPATDPVASAGITCLTCHAITEIHSAEGNGSYTIAAPERYPFARSTTRTGRWLHRQLLLARPGPHRRAMLRPGVHDSPDFCGACHKVTLPVALNDHRFLPGQNHWDSFRRSGVSGHSLSSWRWPARAETNCNGCHMPPVASDGVSALVRAVAEDGVDDAVPSVLGHRFASGNTAVTTLMPQKPLAPADAARLLDAHRRTLANAVRVDIVGLRVGGTIDGAFIGPLGGAVTPTLEPGASYLVEIVVRTIGMGHAFTQGTADSNQAWLEVELLREGRVLARSGGIDAAGALDRDAKRFGSVIVDADGTPLEERQVHELVAVALDRQIPPGAAETTHVRFDVPTTDDVRSGAAQPPIEVRARVRYRKFARDLVERAIGPDAPELPILDLASDRVVLPIAGGATVGDVATDRAIVRVPEWERLYDAAIGLARIAERAGGKGPWRQAEELFARVEALGRGDGALGRARVALATGRIDDAVDALASANRREESFTPAPAWAITWWSGRAALEAGDPVAALATFEEILEESTTRFPSASARGFDFTGDDALLLMAARAGVQVARSMSEERRESADTTLATAIDRIETLLDRDPFSVEGWYLMATACAEARDGAERAGRAAAAADWAARADRALARHDAIRPDRPGEAAAIRRARERFEWIDRALQPVPVHPLKSVPSSDSVHGVRAAAERGRSDEDR